MDSHALQSLLGSNITRLRQLHSLTVEELAEKSGVSTGHMMDVIHGRKWVSSSLLAKVAEALSVPIHVLFDDGQSNQKSTEELIASLGQELSGKFDELLSKTVRDYMSRKR